MSQYKTIKIPFSERRIKECMNGSATRVREVGLPVCLRIHKARKSASWYIIKNHKHYLLGHWPNVSVAAVKRVLPDVLTKISVNSVQSIKLSGFNVISDVLNWYQSRIKKDNHRSYDRKAYIHSAIKCHLVPKLGEVNLNHFTANTKYILDNQLIWPLQETHSLATVKAVLSVLKQAFNKAHTLELIKHNPIKGVVFSDFIDVGIKERDGRLSSADINPLLNQLRQVSVPAQTLVLLLLCFGTRISETLSAKWSHFDFDNGIWIIPASDTKTHDSHQLPITRQAANLLKAYRVYQINHHYSGVYLFKGHKHSRPLSYSSSRALLKEVSELTQHFSAHDLRKLAASVMQQLQIDTFIINRILNHAMSKLDKAYMQGLIGDSIRSALETYHDHLDLKGMSSFSGLSEVRSNYEIDNSKSIHTNGKNNIQTFITEE